MEPRKETLYSRIYEELKGKIERGELKENEQLPTEVMLAESHGVSVITSKRALLELERDGYIYRRRGSGSYVKRRESEELKGDAVSAGSDANAGHGVSTVGAVRAGAAASNIIAMVLPNEDSSGLMGYIQGASDYLNERGYYLTVHHTQSCPERERECLSRLPKRNIAGIILYPTSTQRNTDMLYALCIEGYPIVSIDQYYDHLPIDSVVSDNYQGAFIAGNELIRLGHRTIAFVTGTRIEYRSSVRDRFYGYCAALKEAGIGIQSELFIHVHEHADKGREADDHVYRTIIIRLMELGVTAVQAENDHLALELLRAAGAQGIEVPGRLSIVGFDNHPIASSVERPITTVAQEFRRIGSEAAERIVMRIKQGNRQEAGVTKLEVTWIPRDSTGAVPVSVNLSDDK